MLTVMVCCFLVFGVQKGDENVLNSSRRRYGKKSNIFNASCFIYLNSLIVLSPSYDLKEPKSSNSGFLLFF